MTVTLLPVLLLLLCCVLPATLATNDISQVAFPDVLNQTGTSSDVCTEDYPLALSVHEVLSRSATVEWTGVNDVNVTGYEIVYWELSSTSFQNLTVGLVSTATITGLKGFTRYGVTVRGVCNVSGFGVAANRVPIFTSSRGPDFPPTNVTYLNPYENDPTRALVCWDPINDSQWNGVNFTYIIEVTDITANIMLEYTQSRRMTCLDVGNLEDKHNYIVLVFAQSSGGRSPHSTPIIFQITLPPSPTPTITMETPEFFTSWIFYVATIPSLILLGIIVTIVIICCKMCFTSKKTFVRDVDKYIDDGTIVTSKFTNRFELARISQQNRPLPPNPAQTPTLSVASMNAHLINREFSPPMMMGGAPNVIFHEQQFYPSPEYPPPPHLNRHPSVGHHFPLHHPPHHGHPPLDTDHTHNGRLRSTSVTSPHGPTLSQPLSDLSTSSVFTEMNISHHPEETHNPHSSGSPNPNPYEVPNESETGHHSVSPPALHMHTLPGTRRPQTAQAMAPNGHQQGGAFHHQRPAPYAQSNMELFHFTGNPPIPPHRSNSNVVTRHSPGGNPQWMTTPPQEADYSEIPDTPTEPVISAPFSGVANSSPVGSDQYNSYSDIPTAISPPLRQPDPSNNEKERFSPPGDSSMSESISSFSTDSQSTSPARGKGSAASRHSGEVKSNGRSNSKSSRVENQNSATPYLLPSSIKTPTSYSDNKTSQ